MRQLTLFLLHTSGLDVLFDILDEDGSGSLGYIELRDGLRKMHTDPPVYMSLEDFEIMAKDVHALKGISAEHAQVRTAGDRRYTRTQRRARAHANTYTHTHTHTHTHTRLYAVRTSVSRKLLVHS